ncbi:MAG: hypothetical protein DME69_00030 [Verrucomicrobia bacterium]|nr:MAG: hypothetical protein DME69_00030 [Verrucomicrobiota bacterium]
MGRRFESYRWSHCLCSGCTSFEIQPEISTSAGNLENRITDHNRTNKIAGKFTRKNGPWALGWSERHPDRSSAMRREREIKSWKSAPLIRIRLLGLKS